MDTRESRQRQLISRLRRVEGQIRGVQGMIGNGAACEQVAQQLAAARRALDRSFYEMIACSMERELAQAPDAEAVRATSTHIGRLLARYG
jgi:DNA-binding FrmR family transcriptional regulator